LSETWETDPECRSRIAELLMSQYRADSLTAETFARKIVFNGRWSGFFTVVPSPVFRVSTTP
jgi:hypothetical protein